MSIQLKDLLNQEVKKKLENLKKDPKAKLPNKVEKKKKLLNENKGQDAATELIAKLRRGLYRKLSDKELEAFKAEMINHLGGTYS
tara:strand:- start:260 stop:514 length:255 start_codon:yes stop_codon:yes gene_type:complete